MQEEKTQGMNIEDSHGEFDTILQPKDQGYKLKPNLSINLKRPKISFGTRKELSIPSKEINAVNVLSNKALSQEHSSTKTIFRTRKKLSLLPFKMSKHPAEAVKRIEEKNPVR